MLELDIMWSADCKKVRSLICYTKVVRIVNI